MDESANPHAVVRDGKEYITLSEAGRRLGLSRQRMSVLVRKYPPGDTTAVGVKVYISADWVEELRPGREAWAAHNRKGGRRTDL